MGTSYFPQCPQPFHEPFLVVSPASNSSLGTAPSLNRTRKLLLGPLQLNTNDVFFGSIFPGNSAGSQLWSSEWVTVDNRIVGCFRCILFSFS